MSFKECNKCNRIGLIMLNPDGYRFNYITCHICNGLGYLEVKDDSNQRELPNISGECTGGTLLQTDNGTK